MSVSSNTRAPLIAATVAVVSLALSVTSASAQKKYDPGASDTEIKIGNTMAYSGPASPYGIIGTIQAAYFKKINDEGGVNGRKITYITYDDAYSPPKAVEHVRKLVEGDEVLAVFSLLGTPSNTAVQKYLNTKKVPQLFIGSGATKWGDPANFPWTMGFGPPYQAETRIYAKYILQNKPDAKLAVIYQNDDSGKDHLKGFKDELGAKAATMIVGEESYEVSEPTIDSHIVKLKATNADVLVNFALGKFGSQTFKKAGEMGWKPSMTIVANISASVGGVLKPAGLENVQGIISAAYQKDPTDPQWKDDPAFKEWLAFLDKYAPNADKTDVNVGFAYSAARTLIQVLKQCGDDLTRENVMKQAANLKDFAPGMLLPGILINTSPTDYYPMEQFQLMRFEGEGWKLFGPVMNGDLTGKR